MNNLECRYTLIHIIYYTKLIDENYFKNYLFVLFYVFRNESMDLLKGNQNQNVLKRKTSFSAPTTTGHQNAAQPQVIPICYNFVLLVCHLSVVLSRSIFESFTITIIIYILLRLFPLNLATLLQPINLA